MRTEEILKKIKKFIRHDVGAVAAAFGLLIPVVVSATGVFVDMSQAYLVKARLSSALDAAALAGAATGSDDQSLIQDKVDAFMAANYPSEKIGTNIVVNASIDGDELMVTASAELNTSFMRIFGFDVLDVVATTTVQREVRGLEVVMVLDNTGSMNTNNNIDTLKAATENFIQILFESVSDPDFVKVALVPYASSVNVGPYGLGLDFDGDDYGDPFVVPPEEDVYASYYNGMNPYTGFNYGIDADDLEYNPSRKGQWHGCVLAEEYTLDTEDHFGPWEMYRHDHNGNSYYRNRFYYNGTLGDGYNALYGPNIFCPQQPIVPLTSDEQFLIDSADNMTASGATLGNFGMVWGWRVVSPEEPFIEGAKYDNNQWDKVVLVMTDGINTMSNVYSAYGRSDDHIIDANDLDDRFSETCEAMKEAGILIYTVTFDSGVDNDTKDLFRDCATTPANYNDAPSQSDLEEVFEKIARELSNLHIKQ